MKRRLSKIWAGWLRVAAVIGNIQMIVLLSIIYWSFASTVAIPLKILSDPLMLRRRTKAEWTPLEKNNDYKDSMTRQG